MQAELKRLHSLDIDVPDGDLRNYAPADPYCFSVYVEAEIGPRGERGEEVFGFTVCSPRLLVEHPPHKGLWFARLLVMTRWDYIVVERAINDLCRRTEGPDWLSIARKLNCYAYWEFEDYHEPS